MITETPNLSIVLFALFFTVLAFLVLVALGFALLNGAFYFLRKKMERDKQADWKRRQERSAEKNSAHSPVASCDP